MSQNENIKQDQAIEWDLPRSMGNESRIRLGRIGTLALWQIETDLSQPEAVHTLTNWYLTDNKLVSANLQELFQAAECRLKTFLALTALKIDEDKRKAKKEAA